MPLNTNSPRREAHRHVHTISAQINTSPQNVLAPRLKIPCIDTLFLPASMHMKVVLGYPLPTVYDFLL